MPVRDRDSAHRREPRPARLFDQLLIDAAWRAAAADVAAELLAERTARRPGNIWGWKHYAPCSNDARRARQAMRGASTRARRRLRADMTRRTPTKRRRYAMDTLLAHLGGDPADRHGRGESAGVPRVHLPVSRRSRSGSARAITRDALRRHALWAARHADDCSRSRRRSRRSRAAIARCSLPSGSRRSRRAAGARQSPAITCSWSDTAYAPTRIFCDATLRALRRRRRRTTIRSSAAASRALCRPNTRRRLSRVAGIDHVRGAGRAGDRERRRTRRGIVSR